jgi:hypothetical protein
MGHGEAARFRIGIDYLPIALGARWNPSWDEYFLAKDDVTKEQVRHAYEELMTQFAIELGLNPQGKATIARRAPQPALPRTNAVAPSA